MIVRCYKCKFAMSMDEIRTHSCPVDLTPRDNESFEEYSARCDAGPIEDLFIIAETEFIEVIKEA